MRLSSALLLSLLLGCAASSTREAPQYVAVLDPATPFGAALGAVDARAFVPLSDANAPRWTGSAKAAAELVARGVARYVEPLHEYRPNFVPSDPHLKDQWALADIAAPRAWDLAPSAKGVVVAVVDSGVQLDHPDLKGALWTNEREVAGNGLDDDGNGFVDDVHGWDFVDGDNDPSPGGTSEFDNHGTHVAGIIGATSNNGVGISGIAPNVQIMPVRVMDGKSGRTDTIADGIDYAVKNGADVINLSLGGAYSRLMDEAIARAWKAGVVVVAAAGNDGGSAASFPASSRVAGVLGVGATDSQDALASFSNFGPGVDLTAPGVDILSTFGPSSYKLMSGTSMAAPQVSGAMALRIASRGGAHDKSLTAMLASLPPGVDGVPRLDLSALVEPEKKPSSPGSAKPGHSAPGGSLICRRTLLTFHARATGRRPPPQTVSLRASAPTAFDVTAESWVHPGRCRTAPCRLSFSLDPSHLRAGEHKSTVTLQPKDGSAPLALALDLFVASGDGSLSVEAAVNGQPAPVEGALRVALGAPVTLTAHREGREANVTWTIDDTASTGRDLAGVFPHAGSYRVHAADDQGHAVDLPVVVISGG